MNYEEACQAEVTRAEAVRELMAHGADINEFDQENGGAQDSYLGRIVLDFLGY